MEAPLPSAVLVAPGAACPWGEADRSWTGAPEDQIHRCSYGRGTSTADGVHGVVLEVTQSGGVQAAEGVEHKSLADDGFLGNTGLVIWYSAPMLCHYISCLHDRGEIDMRGASVLDLGAGTGLLGLACACFGATVVLSDFWDSTLALLHANAAGNATRIAEAGGGPLYVAKFDWRQPFPISRENVTALSQKRAVAGAVLHGTTSNSGCFDFVVGTDILFSADVVPLVVGVLAAVCDNATRVLLGNEELWCALMHPFNLTDDTS
jgi:predicted nicotinamide N-methyase